MFEKRIDRTLNSIDTALVLSVNFNNGATDDSGYGHNGVSYNAGLASDRFGVSSSYALNGVNSWIDFGKSIDFTLNANFAVSLWLQWSGKSGWVLWNGYDGVGNANAWMIVINQDNRITFEKYGFRNTWLTGPTLVVGKWNHVVIQGLADGVTGCLYINGESVGCSSSGSAFNLPNPSPLVLGRRGPTSASYFFGVLDDLKIWKRILSASEIRGLYGESSNINENLVLKVACKNDAQDSSGMHHDGVSYNMAWNPEGGCVFNGVNAWIDFGKSNDFTLNANFATSLWFKWSGKSGWLLWNGNDGVSNANTWMIVINQDNRITFEKYGFGNTWLTGPVLVQNVWTHIAIKVLNDGVTGCLYVDGASVGCRNSGSAFNLPYPSPLVGGRRGPTSESYVSGVMYDLRIWNEQLSESNIMAIAAEKPMSPTISPTAAPTLDPTQLPSAQQTASPSVYLSTAAPSVTFYKPLNNGSSNSSQNPALYYFLLIGVPILGSIAATLIAKCIWSNCCEKQQQKPYSPV